MLTTLPWHQQTLQLFECYKANYSQINFSPNVTCERKIRLFVKYLLIWRKSSSYLHNRNPYTGKTAFLIHWDRVTHIFASKLANIGSDNGLSPGRRLAIIRTSAEMLLNGPLGTNLSEISIKFYYIFIYENAFENVVWKMAAILSRPQCVDEWFPGDLLHIIFIFPSCNASA